MRNTMQVFTLKELEKILQTVASINPMQTKDYLQALQDENLIRVEKIGSGNWYWSFTSDAKKNRDKLMRNLQAEQNRLTELIALTERGTNEEIERRRTDVEEAVTPSDIKEENSNINPSDSYLQIHEALMSESEILDKDLACYGESDPTTIAHKVEEATRSKESALLWTENIEALAGFLAARVSDRTQLAEVMQAACGEEYIIGEGLLEL
ncbi:BgTH12-05831 [Blumeria graminis f. sp. triticale]|uniref:Mnd1 family protein n=4 Tax=Blumeria graminis TaxID=34373 RepID=A0A656KHG0_BLUGR|nr:Mnd1 family protein [Blumeria graminis f. sp. tritici 96224]CAD6504094.1 BgTH12-05831 [Blumeria graminis f. sp. triticale]VDB90831.1 Bgt-4105 [Blumeria graminis f. sp. tritici]